MYKKFGACKPTSPLLYRFRSTLSRLKIDYRITCMSHHVGSCHALLPFPAGRVSGVQCPSYVSVIIWNCLYRFPRNQEWKNRVSPFFSLSCLWNQTCMYQVGGGGRTSFLMEFHPDSFPPFSLGLLEGGVGACLPMLPLAGRCSWRTKQGVLWK